jgi:hypothetical protein
VIDDVQPAQVVDESAGLELASPMMLGIMIGGGVCCCLLIAAVVIVCLVRGNNNNNQSNMFLCLFQLNAF